MNKISKILFVVVILLVTVVGIPRAALGAESDEYISDVKVVSAESEDEAIRQLKEAGYTPVMNNLAEEKPELSSPFVYVGYRTSKNVSESIETTDKKNAGSVFGDPALMIGGVAMIIGVVVGMFSMKVRPRK